MNLVVFVAVVAVFVVPLIGFIWLLVKWQNKKVAQLLTDTASNLGLSTGTKIGNRLFEFPSALGVMNGHPVWLGTVSGKREGRANSRYILFQVVVGRDPNGDLSSVGPQSLDQPSESVPFADVEHSLMGRSASDLAAARSGRMQGGRELEVTDRLVIRTFATPGITNAGWARLVGASARVMTDYASSLATLDSHCAR